MISFIYCYSYNIDLVFMSNHHKLVNLSLNNAENENDLLEKYHSAAAANVVN